MKRTAMAKFRIQIVKNCSYSGDATCILVPVSSVKNCTKKKNKNKKKRTEVLKYRPTVSCRESGAHLKKLRTRVLLVLVLALLSLLQQVFAVVPCNLSSA